MAAAEKLLLKMINMLVRDDIQDCYLIEESPEGSLEKVVKDVINDCTVNARPLKTVEIVYIS